MNARKMLYCTLWGIGILLWGTVWVTRSTPVAREEERENTPVSSHEPDSARPVREAADPAACIDVNRAAALQLQDLPGIGPVISERIIAYRNEHGPFAKSDDLRAVKGIGPKRLDTIKDRLCFTTVDSGSTAVPQSGE